MEASCTPRPPPTPLLRGAGLAAILGLTAAAHAAEPGIDLFAGAPLNKGARLEVRQAGEPALDLSASFRSEPFRLPIYWAARFSLEHRSRGWSFEVMHDKLFLDDPPPEVQWFEISHGFNFITVQRAWAVSAGQLRVGLGGVLAHPENVVRHRPVDESTGILGKGYHLSGPVGLAALTRRLRLRRSLSVALEARLTAVPIEVPVNGGEASFTHVALHLLVGLSSFDGPGPSGLK